MSNEVENKLKTIKIGYYFTDYDNLLSLFNKFCELTLLSLIINDYNELEVYDYV